MIYLSIFLLDFFMHFFIFANVRQEYGSIGYVLQSHNQASFEEVEMGIYYSLNRSSRLMVLVILSFTQHLTPTSSRKKKRPEKKLSKTYTITNSPSSTSKLSNLRGYLAEKLVFSDDWWIKNSAISLKKNSAIICLVCWKSWPFNWSQMREIENSYTKLSCNVPISGLSGNLFINLRGECADLQDRKRWYKPPLEAKCSLACKQPTCTHSTFQFAASQGEQHCSPVLFKKKVWEVNC